jgi:hypothetical protein
MSDVCEPGGEDQAARVLQSAAVPSATRGMGGCAYCPAQLLKPQRPSAVSLNGRAGSGRRAGEAGGEATRGTR